MLNRYFEADRLARVFCNGRHPTLLLYITKQEFGGKKHDRPMHSHDNLCELLLVYRGLGSYVIHNRSFPIQEGDVLFYNQDESYVFQPSMMLSVENSLLSRSMSKTPATCPMFSICSNAN